eukprot:411988-Pelagomonas_calceolata.AAC.3
MPQGFAFTATQRLCVCAESSVLYEAGEVCFVFPGGVVCMCLRERKDGQAFVGTPFFVHMQCNVSSGMLHKTKGIEIGHSQQRARIVTVTKSVSAIKPGALCILLMEQQLLIRGS